MSARVDLGQPVARDNHDEVGLSMDDDAEEQPLTSEEANEELRRLLHAPAVDPQEILARVQVARLAPGTRIDDAYRVEAQLGRGGMGVVYLASHEALERTVAIKLCVRRRTDDETDRLLREAQATAGFTHPNIVVVHDVGTWNGQVYVVMEYVEGGTLRDWLRAETRPWSAVVEVFVEAARGLAAAHERNLVHRDFKPDNVLMGKDGRPRVADFGLAVATASVEPLEGEATVPHQAVVTTIAGTPGYMAPEQYSRGALTPAVDQFALCVALYEALSGEHPFEGSTAVERSASVVTGRRRGRLGGVPRRVARAIERGLASDPGARHPSMEALIDALRPRSRGRVAWALVGVGAAGLGAVVMLPGEDPRPCATPRLDAPRVEDARRAELRARFDEPGLMSGSQLATRTEAALDGYVRRWTEAEAEICEAFHDRGESLDIAHGCLKQGARELEAALELLEEGDAQVRARALELVSAVRAPEHCRTIESAQRGVDAREGPAFAEALARAHMAQGVLQYDRALAHADEALAAATLDRSRAQAQLARFVALEGAHGYARTRPAGDEALQLAIRAGADDLAAETARRFVYTERVGSGDLQEAERWADRAEAWLSKMGEPAEAMARVRAERGVLRGDQRRFDEAAAILEEVLSLARTLEPRQPDLEVKLLCDLSGIAHDGGDLDEAEARAREAEQRVIEAFGPDHPLRLTTLDFRLRVLQPAQRFDEGIPLAQEILEGWQHLAPGSLRVARARINLGSILASAGRNEEALPHTQAALEAFAAQGDTRHEQVAVSNLVQQLQFLGRLDEALPVAQRQLELARTLEDPLAEVRAMLAKANLLSMTGATEEAYAMATELEALASETLPATDPSLGMSLIVLGSVAREVGRIDESLAAFDRAEAVLGTEHPLAVRLRRYLAVERGQTLVAAGRAAEALPLVADLGPEQLDDATSRLQLRLVRASAKAATGDREGARAEARAAVELARREGTEDEVTEAVALLDELSPRRETPRGQR